MAAALTIARVLGEDLPAFARAYCELDELGFRAKEDLEPGDEYLILYDDTTLAAAVGTRPIVRAELCRIGSWDQAVTLSSRHWIVAAPPLEALIIGIYDVVGHDAKVRLSQAWYPGCAPSDVAWRAKQGRPRKPSDPPLAVHDGGHVLDIDDYDDYWASGPSFREAAAKVLAQLLRDRCPNCHYVSEGRRGHQNAPDGGPCPAFPEDES